ncbi:ImmA/IrrE family metallo-endopeptidase [Cytobacillus firmus]|uniref:ImmA/IrrE family metallo-endopeptidase n=1 Tax=Cytobacillus firmus TaxID=1399 RepID=UPI003B9DDBCC
MDVKKKVDYLIKKYGTNDPFKLAKWLGIQVVFEELGNIHGYHSKTHRTSVIHINVSLSEPKQLFVCRHELGHAILHPNQNTTFLKSHTYFSTDKLENEANLFAVELMISKEVDNPVTFEEAINIYGIPEHFLRNNF